MFLTYYIIGMHTCVYNVMLCENYQLMATEAWNHSLIISVTLFELAGYSFPIHKAQIYAGILAYKIDDNYWDERQTCCTHTWSLNWLKYYYTSLANRHWMNLLILIVESTGVDIVGHALGLCQYSAPVLRIPGGVQGPLPSTSSSWHTYNIIQAPNH